MNDELRYQQITLLCDRCKKSYLASEEVSDLHEQLCPDCVMDVEPI